MQRAIKLCPKSTILNVSHHFVKSRVQSLPVLVTFGPQQLCLPSENVTEDRDEKTNFIANVKAELMKNEYVFTAIDWFISTLLEGSFESQQCDQKWC